jgi:hypothetical protein
MKDVQVRAGSRFVLEDEALVGRREPHKGLCASFDCMRSLRALLPACPSALTLSARAILPQQRCATSTSFVRTFASALTKLNQNPVYFAALTISSHPLPYLQTISKRARCCAGCPPQMVPRSRPRCNFAGIPIQELFRCVGIHERERREGSRSGSPPGMV